MILKRLIISVAFLVFVIVQSSMAFAQDILGQYAIEGINPGTNAKYTGAVMVGKKGEVYTVGWKIGDQELIGTGLVQGDSFSVVYLPRETKAVPGLVVYTIMPNGVLVGRFTSYGGSAVGSETWKPISK